MAKQKASFVLPTRNVGRYIGNFLESIFSQDYDGEIEVLIMDSSTDNTIEVCQRFPVEIVTVDPEDYNYGKTRNEGAAMTDGDFIIYLSTDIEIRDRKWLSNLLRHFSDPKVAGVFGRQLPKENAQPMEKFFISQTYPQFSSRISFTDNQLNEVNIKGNKIDKHVVLFSNVNSAIRRSVWYGVKNPEMLKSDDVEWAKRVLISGYHVVYDSEAAVYHSHVYTLKQVFREYFDSGATVTIKHENEALDYCMRDFVRDGLIYVFNEYKFMLSSGYWYWIPYAFIYDMMKFLGLFLGSKERYMPLWMKRALCKKRNHWDKYAGVIKESV